MQLKPEVLTFILAIQLSSSNTDINFSRNAAYQSISRTSEKATGVPLFLMTLKENLQPEEYTFLRSG